MGGACKLRFTNIYATAKTKTQNEGGTEMSKAAGQPLPNVLIKVVDLLVESRIRIDAMEQVLVKTNPVAYDLTSVRLKICDSKKQLN